MNLVERATEAYVTARVKEYCYPVKDGRELRGNGVLVRNPVSGEVVQATVRHVVEGLYWRHDPQEDVIILTPAENQFYGLPVAKKWNLTRPVYTLGHYHDGSFTCIRGRVIFRKDQLETGSPLGSDGLVDVLFNRTVCPPFHTGGHFGPIMSGKSGSVVVNGNGEAVGLVARGYWAYPKHIQIFAFSMLFDMNIVPGMISPSIVYAVQGGGVAPNATYYSLTEIG